MFHILSFIILAAALAVSALPIPSPQQPAGWATGYLEPYETYHSRYMAISCETQHGKPFFDQCCHPLLATEKLETARPPQCNPSAHPVDKTSSIASPTVSVPAPSHSPVDQPAAAAAADPAVPPSPPPPSDNKPPSSSTTSHKAAPSPPPKADKITPAAAPPPPSPQGAVHGSSSNLISGGFATFFFQNGVAGACGTVHKDSDLVAAMDARRYGNTGVHSSLCGKQVRITNPANGKSVTVIVADACPTCNNANSIDLSTGAFNQIASPSQGIVPIQWTFV